MQCVIYSTASPPALPLCCIWTTSPPRTLLKGMVRHPILFTRRHRAK
eukprot:gene42386-29001_t